MFPVKHPAPSWDSATARKTSTGSEPTPPGNLTRPFDTTGTLPSRNQSQPASRIAHPTPSDGHSNTTVSILKNPEQNPVENPNGHDTTGATETPTGTSRTRPYATPRPAHTGNSNTPPRRPPSIHKPSADAVTDLTGRMTSLERTARTNTKAASDAKAAADAVQSIAQAAQRDAQALQPRITALEETDRQIQGMIQRDREALAEVRVIGTNARSAADQATTRAADAANNLLALQKQIENVKKDQAAIQTKADLAVATVKKIEGIKAYTDVNNWAPSSTFLDEQNYTGYGSKNLDHSIVDGYTQVIDTRDGAEWWWTWNICGWTPLWQFSWMVWPGADTWIQPYFQLHNSTEGTWGDKIWFPRQECSQGKYQFLLWNKDVPQYDDTKWDGVCVGAQMKGGIRHWTRFPRARWFMPYDAIRSGV